MNIKELQAEWENDAVIDSNKLDIASIETAKLHSKYINILVDTKLKLVKYKNDLNVLKKNKSKWMRGEMSKEELDSLGWEQWQFNKMLKNEIADALLGDEDVIKAQGRVEYLDVVVTFLEGVLTQIKARDFQIKNSVQWKIFLAGS